MKIGGKCKTAVSNNSPQTLPSRVSWRILFFLGGELRVIGRGGRIVQEGPPGNPAWFIMFMKYEEILNLQPYNTAQGALHFMHLTFIMFISV